MKIGSQAGKLTAVSASNPDTIVVRGHDLCADLIGKVSFTDHAWLLVTGQLPSPEQRRVLDAALVAIAEHGLVPFRRGRPHDARRRARGDAGRGRRGHPRLRLGDSRLGRVGGALPGRDPRRQRNARPLRVGPGRPHRGARRAPRRPGLWPSAAQARRPARRAAARGRGRDRDCRPARGACAADREECCPRSPASRWS